MPSIPSHRGDGTFTDLSRRAFPFPLPGYSISMPEFDLGGPFQAEYRLAGLSKTGQDAVVYLAIHDPGNTLDSRPRGVDGSVRLELVNSQDRVLVDVGGSLDRYTWASSLDYYRLYKLHESSFTPDPREEYRLRITYSPDSWLAGYKGFAYVRCGGRK
jgi:hypothetical protein